MSSKSLKAATIGVLSFFLVAATAAPAEEWKRDFTVGAHPQLRVQTNDARIEVRGMPGNAVFARVIADGWHIGPRGIQVTAEQTGDTIFLRVKSPEEHFRFNFGNHAIRIEVSVPQETAVELASSDGSLHVDGTRGAAHLSTSDGSITVDHFDGTLRARTSDGSIHARGRFDLLDLTTSDGRIEAEAWTGSHISSGWSLRTSDGSITVRVADDLSASIDAATSDGRVNLELPIEVMGRIERNRVQGKLHGGGSTLLIHTSDGSITLGRV